MTASSFKKKAAFISDNPPLTSADIASVDGIRTVGLESVERLAEITADAFEHDPFNNWLFKHQHRKQQMFAALAKHIYTPRGFCQILEEDGKGLAATMWMMPDGSLKDTLLSSLSLLKTFVLDDGIAGLKRGRATGNAMAKHHLKEPHAYLFTVGVIGHARGRGLGRKMIEPVLEACDRTGTLAYLENSNPANERVYNSLGFEHITMIEPVPRCPPLQAMKRPPAD